MEILGELQSIGRRTGGQIGSKDYSELVAGRFNRCLIIHLWSVDRVDDLVISIKPQTLVCMVWWLLHLRVMQKCGGMKIPIPESFLVSTALELHSDAAGGASRKKAQGWGVVNLRTGEWARGSWPAYILDNTSHLGAKWGQRLSFLEGSLGF